MAMTKEEFAPIVIKINQAYLERQPITKEGFEVWLDLLKDLNANTLDVAASNYIRTNKFPPTIADLRTEYKKITDRLRSIENQLHEIYDRTRGTYPDMYLNSDEDIRSSAADDARKAWWELVKSSPIEERVARAERIEDATIRFVRCVEADTTRQEIPTLAEFFREALRREARKREL